MSVKRYQFLAALLAVVVSSWSPLAQSYLAQSALAQGQSGAEEPPLLQNPNNRFRFEQGSRQAEQRQRIKRRQVLSVTKADDDQLNFQAPEVEFMQDSQRVKGTGGVIFARGGTQAQADSGSADLEKQEATLEGDVLVTDQNVQLAADRADFNFENETGAFQSSRILFEEEGYAANAEKMEKLSEFDFRLSECAFSSCHCPPRVGSAGVGGESDVSNLFQTPDETLPWKITADSAEVTLEGYAHTYGNTFDVYGVPVLYLPYLAFPVKSERASGLLVPKFGIDNQNGFFYRQPLHIVTSESSDVTLHPFVETRSRVGSFVDYRQVFSRFNQLNSRFIYSNESLRGDSLRGTVTDGLDDPTFDEDRFGGFYKQRWRAAPDSELPISMVSDLRYVSDDLFQREIMDNGVDERFARYVTSTSVVRTGLGSIASLELAGEYNQVIQKDQYTDDTVFQRLPELALTSIKSFSPFGTNPYGVRAVTKFNGTGTNFSREDGYDGFRSDLAPSVRVPFYYKNYLANSVQLTLNQTNYSVDSGPDPLAPDPNAESAKVDGSAGRTVPVLDVGTQTALEKVYDLEGGSWITELAGLGSDSQNLYLKRLKHTIEPMVSYRYNPDVDQDENPFFDSRDRIRERSLVTYGFRTRAIGRFLPARSRQEDIAEITPELEDLPVFVPEVTDLNPLGGMYDPFMAARPFSGREGEIRDLAVFGMRQSYDFLEASDDTDPTRRPTSDINSVLDLFPNKNFALNFESNFSQQEGDFSSIATMAGLRTDRGDTFRLRYNYIPDTSDDEQPNQTGDGELKAAVELAVLDRTRLGSFVRYNTLEGTMVESAFAMRLLSACNCWNLDLGIANTTNPDNQRFTVNFNLAGLGDIAQNFSVNRRQQNQQQQSTP